MRQTGNRLSESDRLRPCSSRSILLAPKRPRTQGPTRIIEPARTTTTALQRNIGVAHESESESSYSTSESEQRHSSSSLSTSPSLSESSSDDDRTLNPINPEEQVVEDEDDEHSVEATIRGNMNGNPIGSGCVTLSDTDVLDCPICTVPLSPPVYQCENGHVACSQCCIQIRNKCPSCCKPIGHNRCRAIEKVLETAKISCQFIKYGCKEKISYMKKVEHEKTCMFSACSCPYIGCNFLGMSKRVYQHFTSQHRDSCRFYFNQTIALTLQSQNEYIFLQEMAEDTLFVVNRSMKPFGTLVNVVCIAPTTSKYRFTYNIEATFRNIKINMESDAKLTPHWLPGSPMKKYLVVPTYFSWSSNILPLNVSIHKIVPVDVEE